MYEEGALTTTATDVQTLFSPPADTTRPAVIRAVDVRKIYRMGAQETHALRGATLSIWKGRPYST